MPIETGLWRIDKSATGGGTPDALTKLASAKLADEHRLEELLVQHLDVLGFDLMPVGRQVITPAGKRADILAIDAAGELYVIELKKDRTPRDAIAQLLDYGSWASTLTHDDLLTTYAAHNPGLAFEKEFAERFGAGSIPDSLNSLHHLLLVASELDAASERILGYCINFGVPINAVFFRYFQDGDREYLARSWLVDPNQAEARIKDTGKEPWTGDYYVSFGEDETRNWDDALKWGFISAGGGLWYSRTLKLLGPGDRVLVHIPTRGFVGIGEVTGERVAAADFRVESSDGTTYPLPDAPDRRGAYKPGQGDSGEDAEFVVPVNWIAKVPRENAYWENGFFANQNSVCKLRNKFTQERVLAHFNVPS